MKLVHFAVLAAMSLSLGACQYTKTADPVLSERDAQFMAMIPTGDVDKMFARYMVDNPTGEPPGVVVVETKQHLLYYTLPDGKAMRYGVALGSEAFGWTGEAVIDHKAEWPTWNPPAEMIARWPHVKRTEGGWTNPLGARALYLFQGGKDTLYRIHGTNEPEKIGRSVSSGCIRMRNIDVIDLYNRVPAGTKVIVR
ncbi:L,D-transpeptidase [Labrys portucalensis]|uniref:L,D-transpeptidase n=1 Tax=Labrys neptuniae TaxID=376174 RepID=A0ABV3PI54_9HYPH|nr:L,D-transpeptidase [Labrys neptuniae]MDT3380911.1 L,D-transpeptidase [Labrys neptuniae]